MDNCPYEKYRKNRTIKRALSWLATDPLFLDTKTTGSRSRAEIVDIAILDVKGEIVFSSLVKPTLQIPASATKIHGITNEMVKNAPTWDQIHHQIYKILSNRMVIVYNAKFDLRLLNQTAAKYEGFSRLSNICDARCAMVLFSEYYGKWNDQSGAWRWQSLATATNFFELDQADAHRALGDARMTWEVVRHIAYDPLKPYTLYDRIVIGLAAINFFFIRRIVLIAMNTGIFLLFLLIPLLSLISRNVMLFLLLATVLFFVFYYFS